MRTDFDSRDTVTIKRESVDDWNNNFMRLFYVYLRVGFIWNKQDDGWQVLIRGGRDKYHEIHKAIAKNSRESFALFCERMPGDLREMGAGMSEDEVLELLRTLERYQGLSLLDPGQMQKLWLEVSYGVVGSAFRLLAGRPVPYLDIDDHSFWSQAALRPPTLQVVRRKGDYSYDVGPALAATAKKMRELYDKE